MPGPPPKAPGTRARRNASPAVVYLPAGGRRGETPPWPLLDDVTMQVQARMAEDRAERLREEMNDVEDKRSLRRMERELDKALQTASILDEQIRRTREVELDLWTELWATPQAQMWEQLAWTREVAQYENHVQRRLLVKPGLTGLWQVSGRADLSWEDSVRLDLYYVENWSFLLDIAILVRTVRAVLASRGAY